MKKILIAACLLVGMVTSAQKTDMQQLSEQIKKSAAEAREQRMKTDSLSKSISEMITRQSDSIQKAQIQRDAERSGQMMLQWHNERVAQQKKKMFMYFGLGAFFFAVLIVSLLRKRKQNKTV